MNDHVPIDLNSIPEYFDKPGVCEAIRDTHPMMLVRQMATEIIRQREQVNTWKMRESQWLEEARLATEAADNAEERVKEIEPQIISCFYGDGTPIFTQGLPTNELQDVATAEELNNLVSINQELRHLLRDNDRL